MASHAATTPAREPGAAASPTAHCPLPTPPPLPDLTDHELHLLAAFLTYRYAMVQLAERENLNPRELLAFSRSPAVQAHLAELRKFADQAFALRSLESRILAIDLLEKVAKETSDPIEKRRTASAILRGLNPVGAFRAERRKPPVDFSAFNPEPRQPSVTPPPSQADSSPSPSRGGGRSARAAGDEGSVSTSSTAPPPSQAAPARRHPPHTNSSPSPPHPTPAHPTPLLRDDSG